MTAGTSGQQQQPSASPSSSAARRQAESPAATEKVQRHTVHTLVFRSLKRTHELFASDQADLPELDETAEKLYRSVKMRSEYGPVMTAVELEEKRLGEEHLALPEPPQPAHIDPVTGTVSLAIKGQTPLAITDGTAGISHASGSKPSHSSASSLLPSASASTEDTMKALLPKKAPTMPKPKWHAPWKLYRVISGHTGWVRCVDFEPANQWFVTGGADRIIKIWDLASGQLKLSLTGHISPVRGVKVSTRQPYLFSVGEDKTVKCWDLEQNKAIRHYHGHLSAVYGLDLHPTLDVLVTCGRDATARVWDMRTKAQIHALSGHTNTVASVRCQAAEPQVITGSHDSTIRLWDLAAGKTRVTLTHHKKSIRSLTMHPRLYMFASGAPDHIKQWKCPDGEFMQNLTGHNSIVNALACSEDDVLVSGGDTGSMHFWDWRSGFCFQKLQTKPQPGSIDSESGIFALAFDQSHTRLVSCETDKSIKMYKEDEEATEETHPILWRPEILKRKAY